MEKKIDLIAICEEVTSMMVPQIESAKQTVYEYSNGKYRFDNIDFVVKPDSDRSIVLDFEVLKDEGIETRMFDLETINSQSYSFKSVFNYDPVSIKRSPYIDRRKENGGRFGLVKDRFTNFEEDETLLNIYRHSADIIKGKSNVTIVASEPWETYYGGVKTGLAIPDMQTMSFHDEIPASLDRQYTFFFRSIDEYTESEQYAEYKKWVTQKVFDIFEYSIDTVVGGNLYEHIERNNSK